MSSVRASENDLCFVAVRAQNDILMQPSTAGSRLLDLISALRTARPCYRLTPHCLYLAIVRTPQLIPALSLPVHAFRLRNRLSGGPD
eukprot:COSAG02_NODE_10183_length_2000_cov_1.597054_3_plen_87_part_00